VVGGGAHNPVGKDGGRGEAPPTHAAFRHWPCVEGAGHAWAQAGAWLCGGRRGLFCGRVGVLMRVMMMAGEETG